MKMYIEIKDLNENDVYKKLKESEKLKYFAELIEIAGGINEDVLNYISQLDKESDIPKLVLETFSNFIFNDVSISWYQLCMKFAKERNILQLRWYCKELLKFAGKVDVQHLLDEFEVIETPVALHHYLNSQYEKSSNEQILRTIVLKVTDMDIKLVNLEKNLLSAIEAENDKVNDGPEKEDLELKLSYYKEMYKDLNKKYTDANSKIFSLTVENKNLKNQYKMQMESLSATVSELKNTHFSGREKAEATAGAAVSKETGVTVSMAGSERAEVTDSMAGSEETEVTDSMAVSKETEVTASAAVSKETEVTASAAVSKEAETTAGAAESKVKIDIKCDKKSRAIRINIFTRIINSVKIRSFERMDKLKQKEKIYSVMTQKKMSTKQVNIIVDAMKAGVSNVSLYRTVCEKLSDEDEMYRMIEYYESQYGSSEDGYHAATV